MRTWLLAMLGLIIFSCIGLLVQTYLEKSTSALDQKLSQVERDIQNHRWDEGLKNLSSIKHSWGENKPFWAVLLNHHEIDLIDQAMVRTIKTISAQSKTDAHIELGVLRQLLQHIPEREELNLINIF